MPTYTNHKDAIHNITVFIAGAAHEFATHAEYSKFVRAVGKADINHELELEFDRFAENGVMYSTRFIRNIAICFPLYFTADGEVI